MLGLALKPSLDPSVACGHYMPRLPPSGLPHLKRGGQTVNLSVCVRLYHPSGNVRASLSLVLWGLNREENGENPNQLNERGKC